MLRKNRLAIFKHYVLTTLNGSMHKPHCPRTLPFININTVRVCAFNTQMNPYCLTAHIQNAIQSKYNAVL